MLNSNSFKSDIRCHNGAATIFVNDEALHYGSVGVNCQTQRKISLLNSDVKSICLLWPREMSVVVENPDYDAIQQRIDSIIDQTQDPVLSCVIDIHPSMEWVEKNQDQMVVYDMAVDWSTSRRNPEPSWASEKWRKDSYDFLVKVAGFVHQKYNGRVILYNVAGGKNGENCPCNDPGDSSSWYCGDFSKPMLEWFRQKLREFYDDDTDKLRHFWSDDSVSFETADISTRQERLKTDWLSFKSPLNRKAADYYKAFSLAIEENVINWCKAIKDATNNESLTASSIGTFLDTGLNSYTVLSLNKNSFQKCLESEFVDMFQSPVSYCHRTLGLGGNSAMMPLGTLQVANKMWFRDFDSRTSLIGNSLKLDPSGGLWINPENVWEDIQLLRRDGAYSIINSGAWFWQEHRDGMYALPEHIQTVNEIERAGRAALELDRSSVSGMTVLVDSQSNFLLSNSSRLIYKMNYEPRLLHWNHAGISADIFTIDDLLNQKVPQSRLIMVTNAFELSIEKADRIKQMAREVNGTIIWLVAPGVLSDDGFDTQQVSEITGFEIAVFDGEILPRVTLCPEKMQAMFGKIIEGSFGVGIRGFDDYGASNIGPGFYFEADQSATVLGRLDALNKPGLGIKKMDGYTSVYCAAPFLPGFLINIFAEHCGVHVYTSRDDYLQIKRELLLLNAKDQGHIEINWHVKANFVKDLYTNEIIAENTDKWTLKSMPNQTHFLAVK